MHQTDMPVIICRAQCWNAIGDTCQSWPTLLSDLLTIWNDLLQELIIIIIQHLYSAIVSYAGCRGACGAS